MLCNVDEEVSVNKHALHARTIALVCATHIRRIAADSVRLTIRLIYSYIVDLQGAIDR